MGKKGGGVRIKQLGPKMPPASAFVNPMEELQIPAEDMVHLPPQPDRKYQIFWPLHETFRMQTDGFQIIYPNYIDSTKSGRHGRRIGRERAVPTPTVSDLSQVLQQLNVRHVTQPYRGYSPDGACQWDNPGRVLVDVTNYTKRQLMLHMAERIPNLPDRKARLAREAAENERLAREREERLAAAAAGTGPSSKATIASSKKASVPVGGNKKKAGKKGKK
jgi:signal recognition particle subunit SEC65